MLDATKPPWLTEEQDDGEKEQGQRQDKRLLMKQDDWLGIARPRCRTILVAKAWCYVD